MDQGFDEFPGPASTGPDARIDGAPREDIMRSERVDFEKADELDDLAIGGDLIRMVRLERMAGNHFWGAIYMRDGRDQEALRSLLASEARMRAAVTKAKAQLDRARPAFTNLTTHQRQLDMDGCEVGVSRQAVDETVDAILAASDTLLATHLALEEPHE